MWPKVLAQLFELLPHIARLVPMADKFLNQKAAAERANEAAFAAMAEGVRGDLGQVAKAHAGLYRQLQDQSAQISAVAEEVKQTREATEAQAAKTQTLEHQVVILGRWLKAAFALLVILVGLMIWLILPGK
ncbi:hypothetical protein GCM10011507_01610 [Edaphobacter acidisoli]|uniref:Uncharacterized protein n=1 Tax=Edaphobacter acidisoli TaxID=2040573 RepID=A0A916VZE0_9BACT|nr:hypothetical protein [Edaphobacter acidisoli]GGA54081.1 hypothetical protein GCM10011507_01610 [Edaphobacter acidisoli]